MLKNNTDKITKKCDHAKMWLKKWTRSLSKDIQQQHLKQTLKSKLAINYKEAENPSEFWENPNTIRQVEEILTQKTSTTQEYNLVIAYLAANIIYMNAQRPVVIENMTIDEFQNRQNGDNEDVFIRALKHKTTAQGPANIVITRAIERLMCLHLDNLRTKIIPQSQQLESRLFLSHTGNRSRKIYETIKNTAETTCHLTLPNPSLYRKVVATTAFNHLQSDKMRALNKQMCHSYETSRKYYQLPKTEQSIQVKQTLHAPHKRSFFTKEEDNQFCMSGHWQMYKHHPYNYAQEL